MLAIITKASDDYWYEFKEIKEVDDIISIHPSLVIEPNDFSTDMVEFWEGFREDDVPLLESANLHIIIYDSYIE